jgi:hypothetical protein
MDVLQYPEHPRSSTELQWAVSVLLLGLVIHAFFTIYSQTGLFRKLGADFAVYFAQSRVMELLGPEAVYDHAASQQALDAVLEQSNPAAVSRFSTVPYPPLFAWLLSRLSGLHPSTAFFLWTALNVAATLYLSFRLFTFLRGKLSPAVLLFLLTAFPFTLTLFLGQIQILLACAVTESYIAFRRSEDLKGGLWLGVLFIKPQYLALIVPVLLWHRRWSALTGMALMALVIWGGSLAIAGPQTIGRYIQAVGSLMEFRSDWPQAMVNWRSLILQLRPGIGDPAGRTLSALLGIVTAVSAIVLWRTGWQEHRTDFPAKMTVLWVATILSSYHSHSYGAAVLAAPLAETWTTAYASRPFKWLLLSGAYLPTLVLCSNFPVSFAARSLLSRLVPAAGIMLVSLILLYVLLWSGLLVRAWRTPLTSPAETGV